MNDVKAVAPTITLDKIEVPLLLNASEVNAILKHLSAGSFAEVAPLIAKIKAQGDPVIERAVAIMRGTPAPPPSLEKPAKRGKK